MIPGTIETWQTKSWQEQLKELITDPKTLLERLNLDLSLLPAAQKAHLTFPLRVTEAFVERIQKGNIDDPLLKQILPMGAELEKVEGFSNDPLEESSANPLPGLVHKYKDRVLFIAATQCAINCRYCFRRAFPYSANAMNKDYWENAANYIRKNNAINEIILSGGDPLVLNDKQLARILNLFAEIPHVKRVRIHSRIPIVLPDRMTDECIQTLTSTRLKTVLILHCNHPQEIDNSLIYALNKLHQAGITLFNQAVLLKGINDNLSTLCQLSEDLFANNVVPYYLFLLDRVNGAAHFEISTESAIKLHKELTASLSGYLVPRLVREIAGEPAKTAIY